MPGPEAWRPHAYLPPCRTTQADGHRMSAPLRVCLPAQNLLDALAPVDGVDFVLWDLAGPAPGGRVDLLVPPYMGKPSALAALEGVDVGLVQSQSIGYDGVAAVLPEGVTFANAAGVHETSTAELAVGMMLASQRGIPDFVRNQDSGTWDNSPRPSLADRRVLLVGYGGVGKAIEARLLPFETEVTRMASRSREDDRGTIHGIDSLYEQLPLHEIVVVSVPLSEQTGAAGGRQVPGRHAGRCPAGERGPRPGGQTRTLCWPRPQPAGSALPWT